MTVLVDCRAFVLQNVLQMKTTIDVIAETYRLTTNDCVPMVLRLTKDRKRKLIRLGISIKPQFWDETKKKIKPNCPNYEYLESIIIETKAKYQKQVLEFQSIGKDYSLQQLVDAVEKRAKNITVETFLNDIIRDLIKGDRVGNANHYRALLSSLRKVTKISQLLFVDIEAKKTTYVVNKNLKKMGAAIGLNIPLTSYVARHSMFSLSLKINHLQNCFS